MAMPRKAIGMLQNIRSRVVTAGPMHGLSGEEAFMAVWCVLTTDEQVGWGGS